MRLGWMMSKGRVSAFQGMNEKILNFIHELSGIFCSDAGEFW